MVKTNETGKINIKEVAEKAGVSVTTVSMALNGKGRISEKTSAHVKEVAKKLGFIPDRNAVGLRSGQSKLIGVIINDISNPFFAELTASLEVEAFEQGYLTVIANSNDDPERQDQLINAMVGLGVAGFIVCPAIGTTPDSFAAIRQRSAPYVICVRDIQDMEATFIGGDDYQSGVMIAKHLFEQGHKNVAIIGGAKETGTWQRRVGGFLEAMKLENITIDDDMVFPGLPTRGFGRQAAIDLAGSNKKFSAVFCYNDIVAVGVCSGLNLEGIQVGKDVAVIGIDNLPESESCVPALSTIDIFPRAIGKRSAQSLVNEIQGSSSNKERIFLSPRLLVRGSTAS